MQACNKRRFYMGMNLEEPILIIDTTQIFMSPVTIIQVYRIPHT